MRSYLKRLRINKKFTQEQVGKLIGYTQHYYSCIENGNRQKRMDIQIASKLADVFGVPVELILNEESKLHSNAS